MQSSDKKEKPGFFSAVTNPEPIERFLDWAESRDSVLLFLIFLLALLAYQLSFGGNFIYDDIPLILENSLIRDWRNLVELVKGGRPVRAVTLLIDYHIWGLDSRGYHLTNFILHVSASFLCFYFIKTIFNNRRVAFICALLYSNHPVHTEAVLGITNRKEMLAMIFLLAAYLSYIKLRYRPAGYILSLAFYTLALLSKQVALALPFMLAAHEMIIPQSPRPLWRRLLPIAPFIIIPAAAFLLVVPDFRLFSRFMPPDFAEMRYPLILATSVRCFLYYVRLAFLPVHLTVDYNVRVADSLLDPGFIAGLVMIAASIAVCIWLAKRNPIVSFGIGWFLINILPVMNIIPSNIFLAERYLYIPSLGVCLIITGLFERLMSEPALMRSERLKGLLETGLVCGVVFLFTVLHFIYLRKIIWENLYPFSLTSNLKSILSCLFVGLLIAIIFTFIRRLETRIGGTFKKVLILAIGLYSSFFLGYFIISVLFNWFLTGYFSFPDIDAREYFARWNEWVRTTAVDAGEQGYRLTGSGTNFSEILNFLLLQLSLLILILIILIWLFRRYITMKIQSALVLMMMIPLLVISHNLIMYRSMEWGSEVGLWKATLAENPASIIGWNNLGRAYSRRGKYEEAEQALLKALELDPSRSDILTNLGINMLRKGDTAVARVYFERAARLNPLDATARVNLANILASEGAWHEAIKIYYEVLNISPSSAHAHYNLAVCFNKLGDKSKALYHALQALRIAPDDPKAALLVNSLRADAQSSRQ